MIPKRLFLTLAALLPLAGCDPNPNGPSAPSAPPSGEPPKSTPGDPKEKVPLKSVGGPIGLFSPERMTAKDATKKA